MTIQEIYTRIQSHLEMDKFLLCDPYTLTNGDMKTLLKKAFNTDEIQLHNATNILLDDKIQLSGVTKIFDADNVKVLVIFLKKGQAEIQISIECIMPANWGFKLDKTGEFQLDKVSLNFSINTDEKIVNGFLTGEYTLVSINFIAQGKYDSDKNNWAITLSIKSEVSANLLFSEFIQFLKIQKLNADIFPKVPFTSLNYQFETEYDDLPGKMAFEVITASDFSITDGLGLSKLGFLVRKIGDEYFFALSGDLRIGSSKIPLKIFYHGSHFAFAIEPGVSCQIPSFNDLGKMVNIDLSNILPKAVLNFNKLVITDFQVGLSTSMHSLEAFNITIGTQHDWEFFSINGLSMKNLLFGFKYNKFETQYAICGTIDIGDTLSLELGGFYSSNRGWLFQGCLPSSSSINLSTLIVDFANILNIQKIDRLPIPDIILDYVFVSFGLKEKEFKAEAKVVVQTTSNTYEQPETIIDHLFKISADILIESTISEGVRSYSGKFTGVLDIDPIRFEVVYKFGKEVDNTINVKMLSTEGVIKLSKILYKFGVTDIPTFVESMDLGISNVMMDYDINAKKLHIKVTSDYYETIDVIIDDKKYEADIRFKNDISLSSLPLVGTHLHLLDSVALKDLQFLVSSEDNQSKGTKSGVALLGNVLDQNLVLQLYHKENGNMPGTDDSNVEPIWFTINKSLGVFEFSRIGIGYKDSQIVFLLDAGLVAKPIRLSLISLGIGVPINDPLKLSFYLSGLGIDFKNDSLTVSGAFLKSNEGSQEIYEGNLMIKFGKISLFATGMYSGDSLMVFALLSAPMGGCPAFFVTGIAAGFGYNVNIKIPDVSQVSKFPLVGGAMGTIKKEEMITEMKKTIIQQKGQNFLAAGVKFTSFRLAESFVLAILSFGTHLEIELLGISKISIPPNVPRENNPLAYAELALKAYVSPEAGFVSVQAQLTSESYILSKDCKLMGGFASVFWFAGENSGDFVITLGGYHPSYNKPNHYPDVPRLSLYWRISDHLDITGELYFALTPSVLMAGGRLSAVYHNGNLKAWFIAKADFYIGWKPFHYDIRLSISIGASYRIKFWFINKVVSIELGVSLHLWGPEFSGTARIKWTIISFTIEFGAGASQEPKPLSWYEFKESFLPKTNKTANQVALATPATNPISLSVANGLRFEVENTKTYPVVFADTLQINVKSIIPSNKIYLNSTQVETKDKKLGILPMGKGVELKTVLKIRLLDQNETEVSCSVVNVLSDNVPSALWSLEKSNNELIRDTSSGLLIRTVEVTYPLVPSEGAIDLAKLSIFSDIIKKFKWNSVWHLSVSARNDSKQILANTIMSESVKSNREKFIKSFESSGFNFDNNVDLSKMKNNTESLFHENMFLARMA